MANCRDQISNRVRFGVHLAAIIACSSGTVFLAGCSNLSSVSPTLSSAGHSLFGKTTTPLLEGDIGTVVADEPQAALIGHDILAHRGNAADAAVAITATLGVTLPSRASLGGGGACLVWRPETGAESFSFLSRAGHANTNEQDRPAGTPASLRGLYLLHHQYGSVAFSDLLTPAISLASNGVTVSHTLADDIATVDTALFADQNARMIFSHQETTPLKTGDILVQPRLANFLDRIRIGGVGDLYNGALATVYSNAAKTAGGGLSVDDLRKTFPFKSAALTTYAKGMTAAFSAPPADGGLGAAMHYTAGLPAQGTVSAWRASYGSVEKAQRILDTKNVATGNTVLPPLPASTSFVVTDHSGLTVACTLTDNNLFGSGRIAGNTGVILGALPVEAARPLLASAILYQKKTLRAAITASGQNSAADAVGASARIAASGNDKLPEKGEGRVNAILCQESTCHGLTDTRGTGLAVGQTHQKY